jgi:hypothetical protein
MAVVVFKNKKIEEGYNRRINKCLSLSLCQRKKEGQIRRAFEFQNHPPVIADRTTTRICSLDINNIVAEDDVRERRSNGN